MSYSIEDRRKIWDKGIRINGLDEDVWRKGLAGAKIKWDDYGDTDSEYGWQVDHAYPDSLGGENHLLNLRPMHHENNNSKDDFFPHYTGVIMYDDESQSNVSKLFPCTVDEELQEKLKKLYGELETKTETD